jgi:tetratricopeptide (TPR) repeat protein
VAGGASSICVFFRRSRDSGMILSMRQTLSSIVLVTCLLAACSGSDPKVLTDKGAAALASGDVPAAIESFEAALQHMDAKNPEFLRASLGRCQALARQNPKQAKEDFLALARSGPAKLHEQDYSAIAGELVKKGAVSDAIDVMDAGLKAFPESPQMQVLKNQIVEASKKTKDPGAMNKLKGLGYTGDDAK